jgi:uncharacterized damage-inducible protein DinB
VKDQTIEFFRRVFAYEAWASRRLLARLQEIAGLPQHARRLLAHTQVALEIWRQRIRGEDTREAEIWPNLSLEECARRISENETAYAALLGEADGGLLETTVSYQSQHGILYETALGDILWHVIQHGGYHRGQAALLLRHSGEEPVNTDYITYVRERAGQRWEP